MIKYEKVEAVRCTHCHALHMAEDDSYFAIAGNITIGQSGGIIGSNLSEKKNVVTGITAYCRKVSCFLAFIKALIPDILILKDADEGMTAVIDAYQSGVVEEE